MRTAVLGIVGGIVAGIGLMGIIWHLIWREVPGYDEMVKVWERMY